MYSVEDVRATYGAGTKVSDWLTVEQRLIDAFADATLDHDWMHVDPERAGRDGPFGGTVAFGFWTMALLSYFLRQTTGREYPEGALYGLNYGFDRVRLMAPVPVGSRIRNHMRLLGVEDKGAGRFVVRTENRVEVEGETKPAMIAEWLVMFFFPTDA